MALKLLGKRKVYQSLQTIKDSVVLKHVSCACYIKVEKNNVIRESVFWILEGLIPFGVKTRFQSAAHGGKG